MFYKPIFENQLNRKVDTCTFKVLTLGCEDSKLLNYDPRDGRGGGNYTLFLRWAIWPMGLLFHFNIIQMSFNIFAKEDNTFLKCVSSLTINITKTNIEYQ